MEPTPEITPPLLSERILRVLEEGDAAALALANEAESPDLAEALASLDPGIAARAVQRLPFETAVAVFDERAFTSRGRVLAELDLELATAIIEAMSPDERADLFSQISSDFAEVLRPRLSREVAQNITALLRYNPESAGGIMTTEFVTLRPSFTVGEAIAYIRTVAEGVETIYYAYLVDASTGVLVGVISLKELLIALPQTPLRDIMFKDPKTVRVDTDQEEVARMLSRYDLLAMPVLNAKGQLLGIVTVDDVLDVLIEEQSEDIQRLGGMEALDTPYLQTPFFDMLKKRAGWLVVLLLGEMLTASAMGHYEGELARAVVLASFIPLIISSGGNSGSQATTLVIRSLAVGEMTLGSWFSVVRREIVSGFSLGLILAVLGFLRVIGWEYFFHEYGPRHVAIALTVALSLVGVVTLGTLAGSALPFLLRKFNFDPASASAPLVATLVDVSGLVIYFTVASLILL
jgi:magnesium transporter